MKNNSVSEAVISFILIILLALLLNPFDFWMPTSMHMMMVIGLLVAFTLFTGFIWKERARDEREGLHRMLADRIAFLVGTAILVVAIMVQSVSHSLDPWLSLALAGMIVAKMIGLWYGKMNH